LDDNIRQTYNEGRRNKVILVAERTNLEYMVAFSRDKNAKADIALAESKRGTLEAALGNLTGNEKTMSQDEIESYKKLEAHLKR